MLYNIIVHSLACEIRRVVKDVATTIEKRKKKGRENLSGINIGIWRVDAWRTASSHHGNCKRVDVADTLRFILIQNFECRMTYLTLSETRNCIRFPMGTAVLLRVSAWNRGAVVMPDVSERPFRQTKGEKWREEVVLLHVEYQNKRIAVGRGRRQSLVPSWV